MVILVIDLIRIFSDKGKSHSPISADLYGPCALALAFLPVKSKAGKAHILWRRRGTQAAKNESQTFSVWRLDAGFGAGLEEPDQTLVLESCCGSHRLV